MTHLKDSIIINRPIEEVYQIVCDVENHPKYLSYFRECKILKREGNWILVKRTAEINGKLRSWIGAITFRDEKKLFQFEQVDGPLKGMTGEWILESVPEGTRLTITHHLNFKIPIIGKLLEWYAVNRYVSKSAKEGLESIKKNIEKNK